jgi:ketosteroid isomerase-like protein
MRSKWYGAGFAVLLVGTAAQTAQADSDQARIAAQDAAWNDAYAAGSWRAMRQLHADDAWQISDRAPTIKGGDAIVASLRAYREMGATVHFEREIEDIRIDRPWALVVLRYRMVARAPGRPEVQSNGTALRIYRRQEGSW